MNSGSHSTDEDTGLSHSAPSGERHDDEFIILSQLEPAPSRANDTVVLLSSILAAVAGVAFVVALSLGASLAWYGSFLAVGFFALGVAVRRYFFDRFPEVEAAEPRALPDSNVDRPVSAVAPMARRPFLTRVLVGTAGIFGISLLGLVPSLGPKVGDTLHSTPWAGEDDHGGLRLWTSDGEPIRPQEITVGGLVTAWPEGFIGFERAAVLVMRLTADPLPPTEMSWVLEDHLVAYSKICTHMGCPVALFRERDNTLFCPCHQSTFDVLEAAKPVFGPAARPLPQLPLGLDDEGFLVSLGDFETQPGPTIA